MEKDPRIDTVRLLIESGHIRTFREIFELVPVYLLAEETGYHNSRMIEMKEEPQRFRMLDFIRVAEVIGADEMTVIALVLAQGEEKKQND